MDRRHFLLTTAAASLAAHPGSTPAAETKPNKAPFRVLYSNDTTNITSCLSTFHQAGEPFGEEMLQATVDEVAGLVDAHFLQPGLGMVPMWPSKVLPLQAHYDWIKEFYNQPPDSFGRFVLNGGDIVQIFVDRCRERQQAAFISFRLNDAHHKEFAHPKPGDKPGTSIGMSVTRAYVEHPERCLNADSKRGADLVENWALPEVRAYKFALITELCENYDLDGLELDFMRFYSLFDLTKTDSAQRASIITAFVRDVRQLLDRTARNGKRRWMCTRIPCLSKGFDSLGLDLPTLVAAGLDMINLSASYFTTQQTDLAAIRQSAPTAAVYLEMCHSTWNGEKLVKGYDTFTFRRATREQLQTTAHLAYARGADGVSLFNFAYYREHGSAGRGPFQEPPFDVLKSLGQPEALATQSHQHWFLAPGWNNPYVRPPTLPRLLKPGQKTTFTLDTAPPAGGWKAPLRLRLQCTDPIEATEWSATLNGHPLQPFADTSEPFPNPSPSLLGKPGTLLAWQVSPDWMLNAPNKIEFHHTAPQPAEITFIDLAS